MRVWPPRAVPSGLPIEPVGEEIDAVRSPATVGLLEEVGPKLQVGAVLLPPGELIGSLVELAGPVYCDWLNAELVAGRPYVPRDCREHGLATAEMIDVSLRDQVVGLDEQHLISETRSCRSESK